MDSKATTKEDRRDSTKGGISHKAQAGGIIRGTSSTRSKEVNLSRIPTKGSIFVRRPASLRRIESIHANIHVQL